LDLLGVHFNPSFSNSIGASTLSYRCGTCCKWHATRSLWWSTTYDSTDRGLARSVCVVLFWCLAVFSYAYAQAFPVARGFTWGQVRFPSSFEVLEENDLVVEGAIEQGVDWFSIGDRLIFGTFGQLEYKTDTADLDFNNTIEPALGIKFKLSPTDWAFIEVGGKYEWEYRWITDRTLEGWVGFINWSAQRTWNQQVSSTGGVLSPAAYAVSTWGKFRYPSAQAAEEKENAIVEGAVRGDVTWWRFRHVASVGPMAEFEYTADTMGFDYNNKFRFSLGLALKSAIAGGGVIEVGGKYMADHRPVTNRTETGFVSFLTWSASWRLPLIPGNEAQSQPGPRK
jgi:hypothetical protein